MTIGDTPPDIVLIHGHDFGDWLSCYGRPEVPTPHIQQFADGAIVFDNAFATAPLCTPARSSIFTGLLPHQNGLLGLAHAGWHYRDGVRTLPDLLGEAGYRTALLGLQHEDVDARTLGYEEVHGLGFLPRGLEVARLTERWFAARPAEDRPVLAVIGLWEAHRPWPREDYVPADPASVRVPPYLPDNADTRDDLAAFYGALEQMDEAFGRILRAVEANSGDRETLVLLTTDHGIAFPRAKSTLYDSGVKVSFIVRPPASWAVPPARRTALTSHLDIVPTLLDAAGAEVPAGLPGRSIRPLLTSEPAEDRRVLYLEKTYHDGFDPMRAVRDSDSKLIRNYAQGPPRQPLDIEQSTTHRGMPQEPLPDRPREELYDLVSDPDELRNVIGQPGYAPVRRRLAGLLDSHLIETDDPVVTGDMPEPEPPRDRGRVNTAESAG